MRQITYGEGGYNPKKKNNNIIEDYDDGVEAEKSIELTQDEIQKLKSVASKADLLIDSIDK